MECIAKKMYSQIFDFLFRGRIVFVVDALGAADWFLLPWKQLCKLIGFLWSNRFKVRRVVVLIYVIFGACKQLDGRWLIAESMADEC